MKSLAESNGQIVDLRQLQFSGTYFSLSENSVDVLFKELYRYINGEFGSQFILEWKMGSRILKKEDDFSCRKMKNGAYSIELTGNVICDRVFNIASLKKYERDKKASSLSSLPRGAIASTDYVTYYEKHIIPVLDNDARTKSAVLRLLNLQGKTSRGTGLIPDIIAHFSCIPMCKNGLFYGRFTLYIARYCLGEDLDCWAESFCKFGKDLAQKSEHTNIHIELNPCWGDFYSFYFGQYPSQNDTALIDTPLRNYVRALYTTEVGWAHFLCRETRELCEANSTKCVNRLVDNLIEVEEIKGGGLFVRAKKPISLADISDLKAIKRYIYEMIMPRSQTLSIDWRIRSKWQRVPVFSEELTVVRGRCFFNHNGKINIEKASRLLEI